MKILFTICSDMEPLLDKINTLIWNTCYSNPENSSTTKIIKHTGSVYSLFAQCLFNVTKNKHDFYRSKFV